MPLDLVNWATIAGLVSALAATLADRLRALRAERARKQLTQTLEHLRPLKILVNGVLVGEKSDDLNLLVETSPASSSNVSSAVITTEISNLREQLATINAQIERNKNEIIEVQKIDPILEATLKIGLENLTKRVDTLEKNALTKWDVAVVVFQLLGTLGAILGIIFAIIKYLHP
jgi:hypothetical protein